MIISRAEIMTFAMAKAPVIKEYVIPGYEDVRRRNGKMANVCYPSAVQRQRTSDRAQLTIF